MIILVVTGILRRGEIRSMFMSPCINYHLERWIKLTMKDEGMREIIGDQEQIERNYA